VATSHHESPSSRLTRRGEATRARILQAAAELMHRNGVGSTSMDEVTRSSGTSKSQLYRHFPDKGALVEGVIELQADRVLTAQERQLATLRSLDDLENWRDALLEGKASEDGAFGCRLGSLASELSDIDDRARTSLATHFRRWQSLLADGLQSLKDAGALRHDADPQALATAVMAALQGGYLLAQVSRDVRPMEAGLTMALDHVRTFAVAAPPLHGRAHRSR
jgi:TetR/AcrR family transcriptional regulator, transcriptional repressor for nem operon